MRVISQLHHHHHTLRERRWDELYVIK